MASSVPDPCPYPGQGELLHEIPSCLQVGRRCLYQRTFHDCTADPKRDQVEVVPGRMSPRILLSASLVCKDRTVSEGQGPRIVPFWDFQMPN